MAKHVMKEGSFSDINIAAFLAADTRPTLVFDLLTGLIELTNRQFDLLEETIRSSHEDAGDLADNLVRWSPETTLSRTSCLGYLWDLFSVEDRWRVITCVGSAHASALPSESKSHGQANAMQMVERSVLKPSKTTVEGQHSSTRPGPSLKRKKLEDSPQWGPASEARDHDWIRQALQTVSPYVDLFCSHDWNSTALGSVNSWSSDLKNAALSMLTNPDPRLLLWGDQHIILYNEACVPIIGSKHPHALGQRPMEVFAELWPDVFPFVQRAYRDAQTTKVEQMPITIERSGFLEETYFQFIMQPVLGVDGRPIAALDQFTEVTNIVMADRRMNTVLKVGEKLATSESLSDVWKGFLEVLETNSDDTPFAALYCLENLEGNPHDKDSSNTSPSEWICHLEGIAGLANESTDIPSKLELADDQDPMIQRIRLSWKLREPILLNTEDQTLPDHFIRAASSIHSGKRITKAVVCPISSATSTGCLGFLLLGLSPRRPYDEDYRHFVRLLNDRLIYSTAAVALPKEYRQIQAAAEETALRHAAISKKLLLRTQEAEEMEAKFTRMAATSPVGCYLLRVDGTPIYLNDAYYRITGIEKPSQLSFGSDSVWRKQVIPEDIPKVEQSWYDLVDRKRPTMVEYRLKREWKSFDHASGIEMRGATWLLVSALPELGDDGEVSTVIGWVTDISLQKWTENMQTSRLAEALEAKRQSERFIDVVSHEMRNPLSAVLQSADNILTTLQESQTQVEAPMSTQQSQDVAIETAMESAKTIILCAHHQKRIVDDILTLSKLDANLMVLCPESVRLEELIKRALKMYEAELESADIKATYVIHQSYRDLCVNSVLLDPSRLLQVLINLLTNAIKFTKESSNRHITISIEASSTIPSSVPAVSYIPRRESRPEVLFTQDWGTGSEIFLLFAVQDTGQGLREEEINSLFVRFAQASPRTNVQYGGSGLGLFISKELTELQGGQIGVFSVPGEGSTFQFFIKARKDVKETRRKLERALLDTSKTPESVEKHSRLSATSISNTQRHFDDGEVSERDIHILMPKIGLMSSPLPSPRPTPSRELSNPLDFTQELHILVVEDNIINQKVMVAGLKKLGCTVHASNNGVEALDFLERSNFARADIWSRHGPNGDSKMTRDVFPVPLSLILMDLEMPVMDGLTCIQRIREMQKAGELIRHVPVAAVTANARPEQLSTALKHGMDIVVTKPYVMRDLLPKLREMIAGNAIVPNSNPIFSHVERTESA